ncbi:IclR family transcriptional regulator [Vibrio eleionomae]|uniref:IclR family transcriptional regulator n=1 Tax=Vibrio eleionomae TaxID=2653505 RepID=UPI00192886A9|nr:IclR family transcriptional regulator [Vibrio eleionomae]
MESLSSTARLFKVIRLLANHNETGMRITDIVAETEMTPASVHRILKSLVDERVVIQKADKRYSLGLEFFSIAANAGLSEGLRELAKPVLLRLGARLNDTIFLLVRNGYDAICLDRFEGPFPIQTFTGDVGGRVALGVGQGSMAILAFLEHSEQEEILQHNLGRYKDYNAYDEVEIRSEIQKVKAQGFCAKNSGLIEGMAGIAVPVFDCNGRIVAALSIGTLAARLKADRLPIIVELMKQEAQKLSATINPFDPTLTRPRL